MSDKKQKILEQMNLARKELKTDYYNMSIGEIINLYSDKEICLHPAYQRLYRWDNKQKTDFIESLIIGIPIPPIFVAQKEDGNWDVVDGVQRLSTILELTGDLKPNDKPLKLETCKYIPALDGQTWETIPDETKRIIKRAKLTINIILTENSETSQYEVFQRLNTGGLHLSDQELRNCLIIMLDKEFYNKINEFKTNDIFVKLTPISTKEETEEKRMELILRYLIAKNNPENFKKQLISTMHVRKFIDQETIKLIDDEKFDINNALEEFSKILNFLYDLIGDRVFNKKYYMDEATNSFDGQMYEIILPGIARNISKYENITKEEFEKIIENILADKDFKNATKNGVRGLIRYKQLTELSLKYFQ